MLNVKTNHQHARQSALNLPLQGFILIRIVAVAKHAGRLQFLLLILNDVDSAESYHTTEERGVLLWLDIILLDDTKGCLVTLTDSINFMASQGTVEVQLTLMINIADRNGIRIIIVTQ